MRSIAVFSNLCIDQGFLHLTRGPKPVLKYTIPTCQLVARLPKLAVGMDVVEGGRIGIDYFLSRGNLNQAILGNL